MNKLKYIILVLTILASSTVYVHAEDMVEPDPILTTTVNEETTVTNATRASFITAFLEKKETLAQLRTDINAARTINNDLVKQIKTLVAAKDRTAIQTKITRIEELRAKTTAVISESKTYVAEKSRVKDEIVNSLKKGTNIDISALNQQKEEITTKLNTYRTELSGYRTELKKLLDEVKAFRDKNKANYQEIKNLYTQTNELHSRIAIEISSQKNNWDEFKTALTNKEYGNAINAFDGIIASKRIILSDLKLKNTLLQSMLDKYKA